MRKDKKVTPDFKIYEKYIRFFYKECDCCHKLVKGEKMWKADILSCNWKGLRTIQKRGIRYYCEKCFDTDENLSEYLTNRTSGYFKYLIKNKIRNIEGEIE